MAPDEVAQKMMERKGEEVGEAKGSKVGGLVTRRELSLTKGGSIKSSPISTAEGGAQEHLTPSLYLQQRGKEGMAIHGSSPWDQGSIGARPNTTLPRKAKS